MRDNEETFTFERFAKTEEYKSINTEIIGRWLGLLQKNERTEILRFLDIAAGTGLMTAIFLTNLPENWPIPTVTFLDQSREALDLVQKKFNEILPRYSTAFTSIQMARFPPEVCFDVAVWGNGIHYLAVGDQVRGVKKIYETLKPGGWFFFNTAFYDGARPDDTLPFYRAQVNRAVREVAEKGLRRESRGKKAEEANFLSKEHYMALVADNGFKLIESFECQACLGEEAWEAISSFDDYVIGALPGYPLTTPENLALARNALKDAVFPALIDWGLTCEQTGELYVPRNWLAIAAQKPS